ncbi:MAG: PDZ domain-containing protein [Sedimentisphaerales bacterium]|nr:PDZ domain-containing protein [Sedimentisphaerales bacterium]
MSELESDRQKGGLSAMWDDARAMCRLLCVAMVCSVIQFAGCRKSADVMEGEPLSEVLLRYTPQVGQTLEYHVFMNLEKKCFENGKWLTEGNERGQMTFSITAIERTGDGYRMKLDGQWGRSNVAKETADVMRDKLDAARSVAPIISDRYVSDKAGTHNLCFPDDPVRPGDEWSGSVVFTFGDLATVEAPTLDVSYRLIKAVKNSGGRYCLIECRPAQDRIEVPLQIGQLGLRCDATATVVAVREDCDAHSKIHVGDVLVAMNGHRAATAEDWRILYDRFVEMPNDVGSTVTLTVQRDGQARDVEVTKTFATLGTMEVALSDATRKVIFDVDRGIIVSDEASPQYSVMYHFVDAYPFVDDCMGAGTFERSAGTTVGPRVYYNQYRITLVH